MNRFNTPKIYMKNNTLAMNSKINSGDKELEKLQFTQPLTVLQSSSH